MKRTVAIVIVALAAVGFAQAAEFSTNPNPANPPTGTPYSPDAPNITQSTDPVNVVTGSIACGGGGISAENYFLRRFFLNADDGITVQYNVTSVDMGIESVNVYVGTTAPISVNTFSIAILCQEGRFILRLHHVPKREKRREDLCQGTRS